MNRHAYTEPMVYCARCAEYKYFSEVHVLSVKTKPFNPQPETITFVCPDCGTQSSGSKIR